MNEYFSFLGKVITFGGGAVAIAYAFFKVLGKSWLESIFAEKLEQLRHSQALELQRLRVEIDSMLSGAIKLQDREFETLPEAWIKLDEAYGHLSSLVAPMQEYPDISRMNDKKLEEFLAISKLHESQKDEVREAKDRSKKYQEIIFWHKLTAVRNSIADLHNYVERNSIFMPPALKKMFEDAAAELWSAYVSKEIGHKADDWKMQNEGWEIVKSKIEPLRKTIEKQLYERLQGHSKGKEYSRGE